LGLDAAGAARKREGNSEALRKCSFAPRTGRAPAHGASGLPAPERLLHQHAGKVQQVCWVCTI